MQKQHFAWQGAQDSVCGQAGANMDIARRPVKQHLAQSNDVFNNNECVIAMTRELRTSFSFTAMHRRLVSSSAARACSVRAFFVSSKVATSLRRLSFSLSSSSICLSRASCLACSA